MNYLDRVPDPETNIKYLAEAEEARSNPGKWFKFQTKETENAAWSAANQIRKGRKAAFRPAGSFDTAVRGTDVLISYVGEVQ